MKAIFTLLIIIFAGALAKAQNPQSDDKVNLIEMGIVMVDSLNGTDYKKTFTITTIRVTVSWHNLCSIKKGAMKHPLNYKL